MNKIACLSGIGLILLLSSCSGSANKASGDIMAADSVVAPTVKNPAAAEALTPDTATTTRSVAANTDEARASILKNIDQYLVPKANFVINANGMENATVTLENTLDKITFQKAFVEVRITGDAGIDVRTDYLTFQNIEPGDVKTLKIANAVAAHQVEVKVVKLKSDSLTFGQMMLVGERYNR